MTNANGAEEVIDDDDVVVVACGVWGCLCVVLLLLVDQICLFVLFVPVEIFRLTEKFSAAHSNFYAVALE